MRLSLIDGDILVWLAAYFNKERRNEQEMLSYLDNLVIDILVSTKADKYAGFIKGSDSSHRHKMFPDYKANRPPAPPWLFASLPAIRDRLLNVWQFETAEGQETDDCISSAVEKYRETDTVTIVCSSDKDFNQLEGERYNPRTRETTNVDTLTAYECMLGQVLTGDRTDNIKGLMGVGPVGAKRILKINTEDNTRGVAAMFKQTLFAYIEHNNNNIAQGILDFAENAMKVILKRDKSFIFKEIEVPAIVRTMQGSQDELTKLIQETQ